LRDKPLLESLIGLLGCGRIQVDHKRSVANFIVTRYQDITNIVIPLFDRYPLMSNKRLDFKNFCIVAGLIKDKSLLTKEDYNRIIQIKSLMNKAGTKGS
jgi:hypothetical protein